MSKAPPHSARRAQAMMTIVLGLAVMLLLFLTVVFAQIKEATWSQKRSHDSEAATVAAEGAIEEVISRLLHEANNPTSGTYALLRKTSNSRQKVEIPCTEALLRETFSDNFKFAEAHLQVTDLKELKNQLINGSEDRSGNLCVTARSRIGFGEASLSVALQMRILEMGLPEPLSDFDLVFRLEDGLIGANIGKDGSSAIARLTPDQVKTINSWKFNVPDGQKITEYSGIPFVQGRVCRMFPKWEQMRQFLAWNGPDLFFCGDVLSPDPTPLELAGVRLHGFGQLVSMRAPVNLDKVTFADTSRLTLAILQKGEIRLSGMPDFATSRFAVYLPGGRLNIARGSRFKGFAFIRGDNTQENSDSFRPDASFKQKKTFVVISGQTMLWKKNG